MLGLYMDQIPAMVMPNIQSSMGGVAPYMLPHAHPYWFQQRYAMQAMGFPVSNLMSEQASQMNNTQEQNSALSQQNAATMRVSTTVAAPVKNLSLIDNSDSEAQALSSAGQRSARLPMNAKAGGTAAVARVSSSALPPSRGVDNKNSMSVASNSSTNQWS